MIYALITAIILFVSGCITSGQKEIVGDIINSIPVSPTATPEPTATPIPEPPKPTPIPTPSSTAESLLETNHRVVPEICNKLGVPMIDDDFRGYYFIDLRNRMDLFEVARNEWKNYTGSKEGFPVWRAGFEQAGFVNDI